jgi:hypothetical protein
MGDSTSPVTLTLPGTPLGGAMAQNGACGSAGTFTWS